MHQVARLADAALPAGGGDFVARALTAAVWIQAGRWTGGKAAGEVAVSWALQSCGGERVRSGERNTGQSKQRLQIQH